MVVESNTVDEEVVSGEGDIFGVLGGFDAVEEAGDGFVVVVEDFCCLFGAVEGCDYIQGLGHGRRVG